MKLVFSRVANDDQIYTVYSIPHLEVSDGMKADIDRFYGKLKPQFAEKNDDTEYISTESGPYLVYLFEKPSAYFPEIPVHLLLTIYFEDHENITFFQEIAEKIISGLLKVRHLSKAFYLGTPHAEKGAYKVFAEMMNVLTDGFFELSKKHETYNLGLAEVLILGDKGGGKTTIVEHLVHGKFLPQYEPTLTPKVLKAVFENTDFRVLDTCCTEHVQEVLDDHPLDAKKLPQGVVYVVDAGSDGIKMQKSSDEFQYWMEYLNTKYPGNMFSKIPVLVIFNKIDLNPDFDLEEIRDLFNTEKYGLTPRYIAISALEGRGLAENFKWLVNNLSVAKTLV